MNRSPYLVWKNLLSFFKEINLFNVMCQCHNICWCSSGVMLYVWYCRFQCTSITCVSYKASSSLLFTALFWSRFWMVKNNSSPFKCCAQWSSTSAQSIFGDKLSFASSNIWICWTSWSRFNFHLWPDRKNCLFKLKTTVYTKSFIKFSSCFGTSIHNATVNFIDWSFISKNPLITYLKSVL